MFEDFERVAGCEKRYAFWGYDVKPLHFRCGKEGRFVWLLLRCCLFGRSDGARGANVCAGAAVDAGFGVDGVDVTLGDGLRGAFIDTRAASYAVVANNVSHSFSV